MAQEEVISVWKKMGPDAGVVKKFDYQTGKMVSMPRDAARKARAPGKRLSRNGNIYWEARKNRSDKLGTNL
mgnify:CR=1 FL=1